MKNKKGVMRKLKTGDQVWLNNSRKQQCHLLL
jgi:hypothetical protein